MKVSFNNVADERIRNSFTEVLHAFESLHIYQVELKQKHIKSSTMQAQPVFSWHSLFHGITHYRIKLATYIKDSENILITDLPKGVLKGWFAHELGHVVDYTNNSAWGMMRYGIRYLTSEAFRKRTEHRADELAIIHGFRKEIIETKRFILAHDLVKDDYKKVIHKYYMSIADAEVWEHNHVPNAPQFDL